MSNTQTVNLGNVARDAVTGLEGTVVSRTELLNGNIQYTLQPKGKPRSEKLPDAYNFDIDTLEFIGDGVIKATQPPEIDIKLGDQVEDVITKATGIVTSIITFLNGCVYVTLTQKLKDKVEDIQISISHDRAKVIKPSVFKPTTGQSIKRSTPASAPVQARPGGPAARAMRICQ